MENGQFLLISCEHGGYQIPPPYRALFRDRQLLLRSHYGYDAGALRLAREMAATLRAPLQAATVSRLLIDLNRSPAHPRLYSSATRGLALAQRREIFERYYLPYRTAVQLRIASAVADGQRVLHVSCHSFTPMLNGKLRDTDLGLLYDPARTSETMLCQRWQTSLKAGLPDLKIRRNVPYKGSADSFTAFLRRHFGDAQYVGVELEVNQRHVVSDSAAWPALRRAIVDSLRTVLGHAAWPDRSCDCNNYRPS
ncbi:MAG TPA: N-formylglutamate amidohydrolase [Burkholderiaceae bacterium]|nr:N-formylglutamate amidohydrolase [Burkholderiaceae bacterium]